MSSTSNENINNSLAYYIAETLFKQWESDREKFLEEKWNMNLSAMKSEDWNNKYNYKDSEKDASWKSEAYIPVTRQKVISAYSLIIDMVMQGGRVPFMLTPSAWSNIVLDDLPTEAQDELKQNMKDMEDLIHQQLDESKADIALMQNVMSMAVYGESYAKKIVTSVIRKSFQDIYDDAGNLIDIQPVTKEYMIPNWDFVSVWDIYRDLENQNLEDGLGIIHRQFLSPYKLRQMIGKPYYNTDAILKVINSVEANQDSESSTNTTSLPPHLRDISNRKNTITYLEFWGRVPREYAEEYILEQLVPEDKATERYNKFYANNTENSGNDVEVLCCIANGEIVRFVPMSDASDRPFFRAPWEINMDTIETEGIADKLTEFQGLLNGVMRTFIDNKALTGNMQLAVKEELLDTPLDEFKPGVKIQVSQDCDDVRQAVMAIEFPDIGESLLSLINIINRFIEENSMVPQISQGIQSTKDVTAFEVSQQLEGSGKYTGGVTRNLDTFLIAPMVNEYYEYNMLNPNLSIPKGNYQVKALGFTSYQNKIVRVQKMQQFLSIIAQSPELSEKFDTGKIGEELAKLMDVEVDQFRLSDEEQVQRQQQQAAVAEQAKRMSDAELATNISEAKKDLAYAEAQKINSQVKLEELNMKKRENAVKVTAEANEKILQDFEAKGIPREAVNIQDQIDVPQEPADARASQAISQETQ